MFGTFEWATQEGHKGVPFEGQAWQGGPALWDKFIGRGKVPFV